MSILKIAKEVEDRDAHISGLPKNIAISSLLGSGAGLGKAKSHKGKIGYNPTRGLLGAVGGGIAGAGAHVVNQARKNKEPRVLINDGE